MHNVSHAQKPETFEPSKGLIMRHNLEDVGSPSRTETNEDFCGSGCVSPGNLTDAVLPSRDPVVSPSAGPLLTTSEPPLEEGWRGYKLDEMELSVRASHVLRRAGVKTIGEYLLLDDEQIDALPMFGQKAKAEMQSVIEQLRNPPPPPQRPISRDRKRGGRAPSERQSAIGFKVTAELRKALSKAAAINDRSLSAEIISRLEVSFAAERESELKVRIEKLEKAVFYTGPSSVGTVSLPLGGITYTPAPTSISRGDKP